MAGVTKQKDQSSNLQWNMCERRRERSINRKRQELLSVSGSPWKGPIASTDFESAQILFWAYQCAQHFQIRVIFAVFSATLQHNEP